MSLFNQQPLETYEVLKSNQTSIFEIVQWHFEEIIKGINRKISLKKKYKDPFTCIVTRDIHPSTFYQVFRAIRDYKITFGTKAEVFKNKRKQVTGYSLSFTHFGALKFHLCQLTEKEKEDIEKEFLSKSFACGSRAKVVASDQKPFVITYKCSTSSLTLKCHYETTNSYGNVTSF